MSKNRILIVDDNEENAYLLRALLQGGGYQAVTAANGADALEKARATPPDLVISDILMPVMDGFTLCREWKRDGRLGKIPFVFYTATYTDERDRKFALGLGADQFIVKPEEPAVFTALIRETIQRVGKSPAQAAPAGAAGNEDSVFLREYNSTLVRKLEDKMAQLEEANRDLVRELAERKRAEEEKESLQAQLFQAQKLESVGRLAGGVAHDFNNMLSVIISYANLALRGVDPAQKLHSELGEILGAARRSAELTKQLLAFARKQTQPSKVIDWNESVSGMLKLLRRLIGEPIKLDWRPGKDLGLVQADPTQLDQILTNLCVNAQDAIAGTGKITIETGNASFNAADCARHPGFLPGEFVRLSVRDTGCGMDQAVLEKIFEPFFTTKGPGKGTGLGLSTVYGIVMHYHGFIDVKSAPGQGADFQVYLPRYRGQPVKPRPEAAPAPRPKGNETILLVEDEPALLNIIGIVLKDMGYTVLAAPQPGDALTLAQAHPGPIDLLLTDMVMPGMSGLELAEKLQHRFPTLKRILMSGYAADGVAGEKVLDEESFFIQKPFSIEDLAKTIREALGG